MKKRHILEREFNEKLSEQEFMLKFGSNSELTLIGAPTGKLRSRIALSFVGMILVTFCLITGSSEDRMNTSFVIGGSLLGLILTSTPFISFYSRKNFKVDISRRIKQLSINKSVSSLDKRIDFSHIDSIKLKNLQVDDLLSGPEGIDTISFMHTFSVETGNKSIELFYLTSQNQEFYDFVMKFGEFLASFIGKELKLIKA